MTDLPPYVYTSTSDDKELSQGDILSVEGRLRELFLKFYPGINHPKDETKYVMVLSQTCDLVKSNRRKLKVEHIIVCLVRNFSSFLDRLIKNSNPYSVSDIKIINRNHFAIFEDDIRKNINNTENKTYFFYQVKNRSQNT